MKVRWMLVLMIAVGLLVGIALLFAAATRSHDRLVSKSESGYLLDPGAHAWVKTGPFVVKREGESAEGIEVRRTPTGQLVLVGGTDVKGKAAPPETFDPGSMRWTAFSGALPPQESPRVLPPAPAKRTVVVACGPGCALALPEDRESASDRVGVTSEPVWIHEGAWRQFGTITHTFDPTTAAALMKDRIVVMGRATSLHHPYGSAPVDPLAWSSLRDSARWTAFPVAPSFAEASSPVMTSLPDGGLVVSYLGRRGVVDVLADRSTTWTLAPIPGVDQLSLVTPFRVLPDGRVLAVTAVYELRLDPKGLAIQLALLLGGLLVLIGGGVLVWNAHPGAKTVVLGGALGGVLIFFGFVALVLTSMGSAHGRPLRVGGKILRARLRRGAAGAGRTGETRPYDERGERGERDVPRVRRVGPLARVRLGTKWASDALLEAASVPAFERLAASLRALGAPDDLVARAREAAREESRHTEDCLRLAGAYMGLSLTVQLPSLDAVVHVPDRTTSLIAIALESLEDGCVGEGLSAARALDALRDTTEPCVRAVLSRIAIDEASHAELAWDVLVWCLREGGEPVKGAVRNRLGVLRRRPTMTPWTIRAQVLSRATSLGIDTPVGGACTPDESGA